MAHCAPCVKLSVEPGNELSLTGHNVPSFHFHQGSSTQKCRFLWGERVDGIAAGQVALKRFHEMRAGCR